MGVAEVGGGPLRTGRLGKSTWLTLALLVCLATGCGFHLRTWEWASQDVRVHVRANAAIALAEPVRRALRQAGVSLSPTASEADFVIHLLNERRSRHVASVAGGARAAEYELVSGAQYRVSADGNELISPRWVEARRVFSIDRTSLSGSSEEQALIERELRAELVQHILRGLGAVASSDADQG